MRKVLIGAIAVAGVAATLLIGHKTTKAADHPGADGAAAATGQDLTDVFAWMDAEAANLNLVANIAGGEFSTTSQFVWHIHSGDAFLNTPVETRIICQFAAANNIECWVGDPEAGGLYVQGDPSDPDSPLTSPGGEVKIFAGLRNDPFFFNAGGFLATVGEVETAAPGLQLDPDGCPQIDEATGTALRGLLVSTGDGATPGIDDFAGMNVAALVIQVDKTLVNSGGATLAAWASVHNQ